jgi:hypothetical protein
VDKFRPLWVVMENVPGIINIGGGIVLRQIHEDFRKIDYLLDCKVINMAAYGVPQTRSRAIFVGNRLGQEFIWPKPTHFARTEGQGGLFKSTRFYIPVEQALGDLPWPMGKYFSHRANSMMRGPRNREVDSSPSFTLRVRGDEFALCATPAKGAFIPGPLLRSHLFIAKPLMIFKGLCERILHTGFLGMRNRKFLSINKQPGLKELVVLL